MDVYDHVDCITLSILQSFGVSDVKRCPPQHSLTVSNKIFCSHINFFGLVNFRPDNFYLVDTKINTIKHII